MYHSLCKWKRLLFLDTREFPLIQTYFHHSWEHFKWFNPFFVSAGCDRLHLLLQDPYECPGPDGTAGQPVARRQQHHRLPPSPYPIGPLLPAGPAGAAASPAPPTQPPQWAAPACPQVVQPEKAPAHPSYPTFKHCPPRPPALYRTLYSLPVMLKLRHHPTLQTLRHTQPKGVKYSPVCCSFLCFCTLLIIYFIFSFSP